MPLTLNTPFGRGHLRTIRRAPVALNGATAVSLAPGNGQRAAVTVSHHGTTALAATVSVVVFFGEQTAPTAQFGISLARPSLTVTYEEIGDAIHLPIGAYCNAGTTGLVAADAEFIPEGAE